MSKDIFNEENQMQSNWIKWGKVKDRIHGTLVAVRESTSNLPSSQGEPVKIYEIKADGGEFHNIVDGDVQDDVTEINKGELWLIGGKPNGKSSYDAQLRNVRLGTKLGIRFDEEKPNKKAGFSPTKVIKVYLPKGKDGNPVMDEEWLEQQQETVPFDEV